MKIIMVTNEFPPSIGGVQTHVYELSRAMVRLGHDVVVITRLADNILPATEEMDGVRVYRHKLPNNHLVYDWKLHRILKKLIKNQGFEVVHIHGMRPLDACKRLNVPIIFTNHTSSFLKRVKKGPKVLEKMRKQLAVAELVLAPSDELVDATLMTGYDGATQFISNGVDVNRFFPAENDWREKLNIPTEAFVAVLARRLVEKNGVLYFAKAIALAHRSDLHVIVAGDGADRTSFEKIINDAGCSDRVHMLGGVDNNQMPSIFSAGDVSILPSLMEATSIAGLEAMACGLPLIGTNVGGIPVIIDHDKTGLLVEPRSPEALSEALITLCDNRELTMQMGKASLERVTAEFSWDIIAEQTIQSFNRVSSKRS